MDTPENYYAILGVPINVDDDTLKRAYRQLARRYHPDLAGPEGATQMKRINRAYDVLSDPEKRRNYDTIIGGVIDLRKAAGARPRPQRYQGGEDIEFEGLRIFSTRGPLHTGPVINSTLGVISALSSVQTVQGVLIAAGSLDGEGQLWQVSAGQAKEQMHFNADPALTVESLRGLHFSQAGALLAGWGRLGLNVWDAYSGALLWGYPLMQRAVSTYYSIDVSLQIQPDHTRLVHVAFPYLSEDGRSPLAWGVRATDVMTHIIGAPKTQLLEPRTCLEDEIKNRHFWAIRLRALSQDASTLTTLSCAQVEKEPQQMVVVRSWDLNVKLRMGGKAHPQITTSILVGRCEDCTPPYAVTPDACTLAFVYAGRKLRLCNTSSGTYSELNSGSMGSSSKLAISPDGEWVAVAREDSEVNEGVIDLWSSVTGQVLQKLYHPWQVSALHFAGKQLVVALTDGTIQIWE